MKNKNRKKRKTCMYCKELGIINHNGIIEINDIELGPGWVCEECIKELLREQSELYFDALEENEKLLAMNRKKPLEWLKKINPYIRKILEKIKGG